MSLRVAVIGAGRMGQAHARAVAAYPHARVTAVMDVQEEQARKLTAAHGDARAYTSIEKLFEEEPLDAVILATPPSVRTVPIVAACRQRVHLLVEKPPALDLKTARECLVHIQASEVVSAVGFQLRYSPLTERALHLLEGRKIALVRTVCTIGYYLTMDMPIWFLQKSKSGGPLCEQAIHVLDAARYLAGDVDSVFGRGDRLVRPEIQAVDSEDTLSLLYRFKSGALGVHSHSCATKEFTFEVEFIGPEFRLLIHYAQGTLRGQVDGTLIDEKPGTPPRWDKTGAFLEAVRSGDRSLVRSPFEDAVKSLAFALAGDRSIQTGHEERLEG